MFWVVCGVLCELFKIFLFLLWFFVLVFFCLIWVGSLLVVVSVRCFGVFRFWLLVLLCRSMVFNASFLFLGCWFRLVFGWSYCVFMFMIL